MFNSDSSIDFILNKGDYLNNTDHNIEDIVKKVLTDNPNEVKRFKDGEDKLLSYFMGKVMKESKGKINHEIIIQELNNSLKKS